MSTSFPRSDVAWRRNLEKSLTRLTKIPDRTDSFSAHRPSDACISAARDATRQIAVHDLPIPMVAAGADGSIQIKWRRGGKEFSLFIEPDRSIEYLYVRDGRTFDGDISADRTARVLNDYLKQLAD